MNRKHYLQNFYELIEESEDDVQIMSEDDIEETEIPDEEEEENDEDEDYEEETIYAPFGPNGPVIRYRTYTIEDLPEAS